jgi:hypothetical protein
MNGAPSQYWFPAKLYGWGWGLPTAWQGWVVLVTWFIVLAVMAPIVAWDSLALFFVFIAAMVAALFSICWAKGEPPRWRWGK